MEIKLTIKPEGMPESLQQWAKAMLQITADRGFVEGNMLACVDLGDFHISARLVVDGKTWGFSIAYPMVFINRTKFPEMELQRMTTMFRQRLDEAVSMCTAHLTT